MITDETKPYPLRIFLSYTRKDLELVKRIDTILNGLGLHPVWDRDIRPGSLFKDYIKDEIATAHIFMPIITEQSQHSPWVHQETGYAMGVNIPVLPLALDSIPGEMIAEIQAIRIRSDLEDLAEQLQSANLEALLFPPPSRPFVNSHVADSPEERTQLIVKYGEELKAHLHWGKVRQRAFFSSFSIPLDDPQDAPWDVFESRQKRQLTHRQHLREERIILMDHARKCGCKLIINPLIDYRPVGAAVHRIQLTELISFLESMPDDQVEIVLSDVNQGNWTILGDWMEARAVIPLPGLDYTQTVFFGHGPTVLRSIREFDQLFDEKCELQGVAAGQSQELALERLRERLWELPEE